MRRAVLSIKQRRLVLVALAVFAAAGLPAAGPAGTVSASPLLAPRADTEPPSVPQGMAFSGRTGTTVSLVWRAATDNVGVVGYRVFKNGRAVSTVAGLRHTYRGLRCGTSYTFALEAYDAAGNASHRPEAVGTISTVACLVLRKPPKAKPTPRTPPKAGLAQVWVDTNGGSCRRKTGASAYSDAEACPSLAAAYAAAADGDTVTVVGGTYGNQSLPAGSKRMTIRNAPGTKPVFRSIGVAASNLTISGLHVDAQRTKVAGIYVEGDHNTFRNGSVHGIVDEKGVLNGGSNTIFDHFDFYDVFVTHSEVHNECFYSNGPNLTVRNSHFWNCATMDLFITRGSWWNQPLYGGVVLENNVFGHSTMIEPGSWHYYSLGINGGVIQEMRNWRVVNNTFESPVGGSPPAPGTLWANNLGDWNCFPQATFTNNVGKKCAASDKAVERRTSFAWVDPAKHDFRLTARSPAVNAADAKFAPQRDRQGRPRNGAPDAGAYEYWP